MISSVRRAIALTLAACAPLATPLVFGSEFPSKPVRIVVPYQPGGSTDAMARMIGQKLSERLGQPVVIENKPGASEQVGAVTVAKSPADGYTVMMATTIGLAINPSLFSKLQYDPAKDFAAILPVAKIASVVAVSPQLPVKNMEELTTYLKAHPGKISYGSAGSGAPSHLAMELYKRAAGVHAVHVPYKGGAPALQDLMAGNIDVMIALVSEAMPLVKAGKLKALAVTSPSRNQRYPELAPVADSQGMKNFEIYLWYAMVAPAGTPKDVVEKLNQSINAVLNEKDMKDRLAEMDIELVGGPASRVATIVSSEGAKWKKVIDEAGIRAD
ncbi:Tripartite-type tricarboxylate transporter, receptor component TctC [Variovorax sp. CF079]|uniref:Bug family tripartite tricarboxylate transporter substrate binding protein n=1 Tax=Variovorax sp. CF079 TaxID=1882774 RepID=UPI00088088B8|nr:tripartite tricarboxylate transporter substrate binding protein [Variovorax sp. CF079]SDD50890.1 Tripartite-type tricarboxylate transporter, receptor component TctC [Variovorax sp. CF079]